MDEAAKSTCDMQTKKAEDGARAASGQAASQLSKTHTRLLGLMF